jgi:hypothetical protein
MKTKQRREEEELPEMPEIDFTRCKIIRRGPRKDRKLVLAVLRASQGLTQEQIAKRAGITQSETSRLELRTDCRVSTLKRYAKALGGELLIYVQIDGRKYPAAL